MFFDKKATIKRKTGTTPTQSWQTVNNSCFVNVQPATTEATVISEGEFCKVFTGFTAPEADIIAGDKLVVNNSAYTVRGVQRFDNHLHLTLLEL